MKANIGLLQKDTAAVSGILTVVLSNQMVLYTKTRKFHWNVSGDSFMELHKLFEKQYKQLEEAIDETAERIAKLGYKAIGTMQEFIEHATLKEAPGKNPTQKEMLKELLTDHELP